MLELYRPRQVEQDEPNIGQVGDIVKSMLTETEFQALRGSGWVLMDGRGVTAAQLGEDSEYYLLTGNTNIPDARGRFLRARDYGELNNPDGDQPEGTTNPFKTSANDLSASTNTTGTHSHSISANAQNTGDPGGGFRYSNATGNVVSDFDGTHGHGVTVSGQNETAPVNLIVNMFIKIN